MRWLVVIAVFAVTAVISMERIAYETETNEATCFEAFIHCHGRKIPPSESGLRAPHEGWDQAVNGLFSSPESVAECADGETEIQAPEQVYWLDPSTDSLREVYWVQTGLRPAVGSSCGPREPASR